MIVYVSHESRGTEGRKYWSERLASLEHLLCCLENSLPATFLDF